jgi:hypothetical protein
MNTGFQQLFYFDFYYHDCSFGLTLKDPSAASWDHPKCGTKGRES